MSSNQERIFYSPLHSTTASAPKQVIAFKIESIEYSTNPLNVNEEVNNWKISVDDTDYPSNLWIWKVFNNGQYLIIYTGHTSKMPSLSLKTEIKLTRTKSGDPMLINFYIIFENDPLGSNA
eukprot:21963_1